jgi:HemY protein
MVRLVLILLATALAATGLAWLADQPGTLVVNWQGYEIETSVFRAFVMLLLLIGIAIVVWSVLRQIWLAPASVGLFFNRRRQRRGLDALSTGMIAIGAGDRSAATQSALTARRALPDEPLTHLLRAQAAQLSGDRVTSRRIFEAMLGAPETEVLGLRGLFLEAEREGETEAAKQFAERAMAANPKLAWSVDALFDKQAKSADWPGALKTLNVARKHNHIDKATADRRRAVALTAMAMAAEDSDGNRALALAQEAHALAPDLVPAAAIAGRLWSARGNPQKVAKVIQKTWRVAQHPDLATAYAYSRLGDSPRDRLARIEQLAAIAPNSAESGIAVAAAAIEARDFDRARKALQPLLDGRLTQRVATLMARIEGEQHGDRGRVREWLARAVNAPRDPQWTADGRVSDTWAPLSPVTKTLDAFEWRVAAESVQERDTTAIAAKLEELVELGSRSITSLPGAPRQAFDESVEPPSPTDRRGKPTVTDFDRDGAAIVAPKPVPAAAPAVVANSARVEPGIAAPTTVEPPTPRAPDMPIDRTPPRPAYASSLVKKKPDPTPSLKSAATKPTPAEVDAIAAGLQQRDPTVGGAGREAVATAAAALAAAPKPKPATPSASANSGNQRVAVSANGSKPGEPKIFVAPRAPDDPGTEPSKTANDRLARRI